MARCASYAAYAYEMHGARIPFNLYRQYLTKEDLKGVGGFQIGGQVIRTAKYVDGIVLLAKEKKNCVTG